MECNRGCLLDLQSVYREMQGFLVGVGRGKGRGQHQETYDLWYTHALVMIS